MPGGGGGRGTHHFPSLLDHVPGLQEVLAGHGDVLVVLAVIVIVVVAVLQVPRVLMTPATCAQSGAPGEGKDVLGAAQIDALLVSNYEAKPNTAA